MGFWTKLKKSCLHERGIGRNLSERCGLFSIIMGICAFVDDRIAMCFADSGSFGAEGDSDE